MSRETDSPPPSPRGGEPQRSLSGEGATPGALGASGGDATETTLTTRIRINIPGSRPIPPVVVRETVRNTDVRNTDVRKTERDGGALDGGGESSAGGDAAPAGEVDSGSRGAGGQGKKTSSWFEPRKPPGNAPGAADDHPTGATPRISDAFPALPRAASDTPPGSAPVARQPSSWFQGQDDAPRAAHTDTPVDGVALTGGAPTAPGGTAPSPAGSRPSPTGDVAGPLTQSHGLPPLPVRNPRRPPTAFTPAGALPGARGTGSWFQKQTDTPVAGVPQTTGPARPAGPAGQSWAGQQAPYQQGHPQEDTRRGGRQTPPSGMPLAPGADPLGLPPRPMGAAHPPGLTTGPVTGAVQLPRPEAPVTLPEEEPGSTTMDLGGPFPPAPPPGVRDLADTGVLAPVPAAAFEAPPSGTSGPGKSGSEGRGQSKGRGRGRPLLKLLAAGLFGVAAVAYGAGLLLNRDDVPAGTTVLGIDIGGTSTHEAVSRLDDALDIANNTPFHLRVGEAEVELEPSVAGLAVDPEATVATAAGSDYNPVTVIGSLLGAERTAEAVFDVDREKLVATLEDIAADSGSGPVEGDVTFTPKGAKAHFGKAGRVLDVRAAADLLEEAFRGRAASSRNPRITVPTATQRPQISDAAVRRAMEEFAEPAMSGIVTVSAGDALVQFSPENSLHQFLSMEPVDGKLVDAYDLEVLERLYGATFDGVKIVRGDGSSTPVGPADVAGALRMALRETDPDKRVSEIDLG